MKVLLVDPYGPVKGINTGLGYLAALLIHKNIEMSVLDFCNRKEDADKRLTCALKNRYDVIGFSVKACTVIEAAKLARKCKCLSEDSVIIAGGPQVTIQREEFLQENPVFDYILCGEGEYNFLDFLRFVGGEKDCTEVKGLCYKDNGNLKVNPASFIENLDEVLFPDYSAFDNKRNLEYKYPLVTSRGCPYNCIYCSVNLVSGKKFRKRSPENVIEELKQAVGKYGIKRFEIVDDTFTQDKERAKEICRLLIKENLSLNWRCPNGIRADRIDKELLQLMKSACCQEIWFGLESLDPEVFNCIQKGEDIEGIVRAIKWAKRAGMNVGAFFIIGLPGSSYEKDLATLQQAKKLGIQISTWSFATPMPHTRLWDWAKKNTKSLNDYRKLSFFVEPRCSFETNDYPEEQRFDIFYKANLSFCRYDVFSAEQNYFKKLSTILRLIWKHDRKKIFYHFVRMLSQFSKSQFSRLLRKKS